jgi:hypothetical protein
MYNIPADIQAFSLDATKVNGWNKGCWIDGSVPMGLI